MQDRKGIFIMLHPSYTDLMQLVNSEVESGEAPVVNSRYSIVLATSKRARQLIDGVPAMSHPSCPKQMCIRDRLKAASNGSTRTCVIKVDTGL